VGKCASRIFPPGTLNFLRGEAAQKELFCDVENARSAFSTSQNNSSERRRRSPVMVMGIRQTLKEIRNSQIKSPN